MPIYEFECEDCNARSSILVLKPREPFTGRCSACGSSKLARIISRCTYHKSASRVWEESGPAKLGAGPEYYKDPRNIGRWTEQKFKDMGMEMPREINDQIQAAREGELPKSLKDKL